MQQATDPVTREIIKNALMSSADTMALTVVRTARSAVIKHSMDFSTALFSADGQQVAQGLTLPSHLGSMAPALEGIMNAFGDDVHPGDIFANNDPYEGGSHLPDIFLFKPIFAYDTLVGWSCCIGHQTDIGGRIPGGNACDNTEIYQEGLLLPPLKLYDRGVLNQAVWRILGKNVRVPEKVLGDVQALLAAVRFGERDLLRLVDDYGVEEMKSYMSDILDTTERMTRAEIQGLPDGEWEFTDYIDNDGIDAQPIAIHAKVKIEGDTVYVDFDGTSPQAKGSINPNFAYTKSQVYAVMKHLIDESIQSNSGFFRAFEITAPEGCFVNPQHPAPVAARGPIGLPHYGHPLRRHGPGPTGEGTGSLRRRRGGPHLRRVRPQPQGLGLPGVQQRRPQGRRTLLRRRRRPGRPRAEHRQHPHREYRGGPAPDGRAVRPGPRHRGPWQVPGRPGHNPGVQGPWPTRPPSSYAPTATTTRPGASKGASRARQPGATSTPARAPARSPASTSPP